MRSRSTWETRQRSHASPPYADMPGIFGIVQTSGSAGPHTAAERLTLARRMAATMWYDAEYSCELFDCPDAGVSAGRVGLPTPTFLDTAALTASQPADETIVVTAGEPTCDGYPGAAWTPEHAIRGSGLGARDVACSYAHLGDDVVTSLNGVFAGFVVDRRRRASLLFTDPYGIERLFILRRDGQTFFSSEAKALLAIAPDSRRYDPDALAEFLACGCTFGTRSLFRDIDMLEGGTVVRFTADGGLQRRRYVDRAGLEATEAAPEDLFRRQLAELLHSAVHRVTRHQPRVAISLTGGVDSRIVMACLDAAPRSVPCYTFGSLYRDTFDVSVARVVAERCHQVHQVLALGADFLRDLPRELESAVIISDGHIGVSGAAELFLNRMARSIAPVRITGNWGGELLRGVRAFKHRVPGGRFVVPPLMAHVQASGERFIHDTHAHPLSFALFHQAPHQAYGRHAVERSQVITRSPFLDRHVVRWLYHAPRGSGASTRCAAIIGSLRPELLTIPTDQGMLGAGGVHAVLEQCFRRLSAKAEYWTGPGAPAVFLWLTAFGQISLIETLFRGRHKFQHFHHWFRTELAPVVRETVLDAKDDLRDWFDMRRVERIIGDHLAGRRNYTDEIDALLTIAMTTRTLLSPPRAVPDGAVSNSVTHPSLNEIRP